MEFYDLNARADSPEDLEEALRLARELGFSGLGLVIEYSRDFAREMESLKKQIKTLKPGLDISLGVEIPSTRPGNIKKIAQSLRKRVELILVSGGEPEANRRALETPEVDILCHPSLGRNDSGIDHVMAKLSAKNNVSIEFNFNEIIYVYKKRRSQVLQNLLAAAGLVKKYRAPFTLSSGAQEPWNLRGPSELITLARLLGLPAGDAKRSLSGKILQENRKRLGKGWVMPGVEVGK